jgi:DNA-binding response OmpR family regulator
LSHLDSRSLVRSLRQEGVNQPLVLLAEMSRREAGIAGLDAGADDFLVKPVEPAELLSRIRAVQRRFRPMERRVVRVADLEVDLITRSISRNGRRIALTNREFLLLEVLMLASPCPISKEAILERVWGRHASTRTNVVNVYIAHLRGKIDRPGLPPLVHTLPGVGFALFHKAEFLAAQAAIRGEYPPDSPQAAIRGEHPPDSPQALEEGSF